MTGYEPGLLDKLFDTDRHGVASSVLRLLSLDELKASVARDLESLLNTRIGFTPAMLAEFPECQRSVLTYGLNDFAGLSVASFDDRTFICTSIEQAISRHEPRLRNVRITLEMHKQATTSALHFGIAATLTLSDLREPVSFDALLQPTTLQYSVSRGAAKARGV
jgi:type VI secretion system protein ImpF